MFNFSRLFRSITFYLILLFPLFLNATTFRVTKGTKFSTIQSALNKAHASDTILVSSGIYFEKNIIINKTITLIGENLPVLDGEGKYEIISIKSSNVIFSGFKIQHSGYGTLDDLAGIKIYDSNNVTISNNVLDDNFFGIYVQFGKKCIIKNNHITSYGKEEQKI